jgi:thiamine pyrophosphokinase
MKAINLLVIVANGEISDYAATREKIAHADYFIACDGGLRHFEQLNAQPNCVIGDFDSIDPSDLLKINVIKIPFPAKKDDTDLALAIAHACTLQPASIIIIGALGGRIDHALGNIHALTGANNVPAEIWAEHTSIRLVQPSRPAIIPRGDYATLSLIPLGGSASGITTRGLSFPLTNEALHPGHTRGISNTFNHDTAEISLTNGTLIIICHKKELI